MSGDDGDLLRELTVPGGAGVIDVRSPLQGTVVSLEVAAGDVVRAGAVLMLIESMKMHHDVAASEPGRVVDVLVGVGTAVMPGDRLVVLEPVVDTPHVHAPATQPDERRRSRCRADLAESIARHAVGLDAARPTPSPAAASGAGRPPGERRRPRRRRLVRRVRPARDRRPAPPPRPSPT